MSECGVYVDQQGTPITSRAVVEWEGKAVSIAAFKEFVLIFDSSFIEIRRVDTGRLVQIMPLNDVRCVRASRSPGVVASKEKQEEVPQDQAVYATTTSREMIDGKLADVQSLVELVLMETGSQ